MPETTLVRRLVRCAAVFALAAASQLSVSAEDRPRLTMVNTTKTSLKVYVFCPEHKNNTTFTSGGREFDHFVVAAGQKETRTLTHHGKYQVVLQIPSGVQIIKGDIALSNAQPAETMSISAGELTSDSVVYENGTWKRNPQKSNPVWGIWLLPATVTLANRTTGTVRVRFWCQDHENYARVLGPGEKDSAEYLDIGPGKAETRTLSHKGTFRVFVEDGSGKQYGQGTFDIPDAGGFNWDVVSTPLRGGGFGPGLQRPAAPAPR